MKIKSYLGIIIVGVLLVASFMPGVKAQDKDIYVQATGFIIYTDLGLAFQSGYGTQIMEIEVLTGTWGGENCVLGVTERGGNLYFESNETCTFQITNYDETNMRLTYEGCEIDVLVNGFSWNGTFPDGDTAVLIHWSWALNLPHEENWTLFMGLFGIGLLLGGLLFLAYLIKTYPLFSLSKKEILFDKISFPIAISAIIIGFGFIIMWLMG